jgi:hypothetical protein
MVFRAFPQMERCAECDEEDRPVEQAHLLADLWEDALVFIPETF